MSDVPDRPVARARPDVQAAAAKGPVGEQRSSIIPELTGVNFAVPSWSYFLSPERELTPAWTGRQRTETVETMLNDSQITAVRQVVRLPTNRYVVELAPLDASPVDVDLIASDLDVPIEGEPEESRPGRRADRFSMRRLRDRAWDALDFGHAVFEHVGRIDQAGYWRLTDLSPVPQWTINDPDSWEIDRHGRLLQVVQRHAAPPIELPVDRLVVFTWQGKPGDPRGRSMLRPLYGAWLLRDRTLRVLGMSGERTGMGIPIGKVPPGAPQAIKEQMERLLAGLAAGQDTNLVIESDKPVAESLMLMGVTGTTPDLVSHLRYHDESIARAMLAMLLQLGQTEHGSRALGLTFDALLELFHEAVMTWFCDVMTEQLVERWIDRNRGPEAPAPRLTWRERTDEEISGDDDPEAEPTDSDPQTVPVTARRRSTLTRRRAAVAASFATITGRELRREPTNTELTAGIDLANMEMQHVTARDDLETVLLAARAELVGVAVEAVADMGSVDPLKLGDTLAPIVTEHAEAMSVEQIATRLQAACTTGVGQVIGEAASQGVAIDTSADYTERAETEARDMLRRIAGQVTESAAASARTSLPMAARRGLVDRLLPSRFAAAEALAIAAGLAALTAAFVTTVAAAAVSRATNAGRAAAIKAGPPATVYASEALDLNTCGPCRTKDGTEYPNLDAALVDYPGGGLASCEGRERCRGTLVAVFETA